MVKKNSTLEWFQSNERYGLYKSTRFRPILRIIKKVNETAFDKQTSSLGQYFIVTK